MRSGRYTAKVECTAGTAHSSKTVFLLLYDVNYKQTATQVSIVLLILADEYANISMRATASG